MQKRPLPELELEIQQAKEAIPVGSKWQHYKGGKYAVVEIAMIELTSALAVVYVSLERPTVRFIRPLVEWQDVVEHEGAQVYRFRRIGV